MFQCRYDQGRDDQAERLAGPTATTRMVPVLLPFAAELSTLGGEVRLVDRMSMDLGLGGTFITVRHRFRLLFAFLQLDVTEEISDATRSGVSTGKSRT